VWVRDDAMLAASGDRGGPTVLIEGRRAPFGVLGLHSHQPRDYQAGDVDFVRSLAIVLGEAVERLISATLADRDPDPGSVSDGLPRGGSWVGGVSGA
jgi:hypothetical protein